MSFLLFFVHKTVFLVDINELAELANEVMVRLCCESHRFWVRIVHPYSKGNSKSRERDSKIGQKMTAINTVGYSFQCSILTYCDLS